MDLRVLLESPQGSQSSSRVGACTCAFLPSCSSIVALPFAWIKGSVAFTRAFPTGLSLEAFPRGFPTSLSHVPPWCQSILGVKIKAVQGKQVPLEWTDTSGGLLKWCHDHGVPLAFPVGRASCRDATGTPVIHSNQAGKKSLISSFQAETGLLWIRAEPSCFVSSGDGYIGGIPELQQGCEGPFGSSRG